MEFQGLKSALRFTHAGYLKIAWCNNPILSEAKLIPQHNLMATGIVTC